MLPGDVVAAEDINLGDRLMGSDGDSFRTVLELKRGREPMYRFTYSDGSSHVFNESHILMFGSNKLGKGKRVSGELESL